MNGGDFDTFCDVSVAAVHGNSVQGLYPDKSGLFGYHKYDTGDENAYFYEYDAAGYCLFRRGPTRPPVR